MMETYSTLLNQDTSRITYDLKVERVVALRCFWHKLFPDLS
jgi:hypothetical protein